MDQLLLAGQPCSEAEWNLTQNGLQWKVNNKRKWTYDSGRSINLPSPECQNKRESRSWVHLGKNFILPKEQAAYWKEAASPEWSKGGKRSEKMLRVSWTIHSLFSSRDGITSTFSTTDPQKLRFASHAIPTDLGWTLPSELELTVDLVQSRNSTWPRSQVFKDNSQIPTVYPRTQDVLSGQCGLLCLAVARASQRLTRDLTWLLCKGCAPSA